ncbi:MAG: hypothetical protein E7614_02220 [Ruminococcaceae bacterium]|nr:hypothetical protein [Oscillospiraceae bacterium]
MTYVMGDLHGMLDQFCDMLTKIKFKDSDTLYILGDIVDKGADSIKLLQNLSYRPNIYPVMGNHDKMALDLLSKLPEEAGQINPADFDKETLAKILEWSKSGGMATISEFMKLTPEEKEGVLEYLGDIPPYEISEVNGNVFILAHAGIADFDPSLDLEEYEPEAFYTEAADYSKTYYEKFFLVTAHTPTEQIDPAFQDKIYKGNNHIAIETGVSEGGPLSCICLDNGREYYVY